jgi:hypothetical protein
MYYTCITLKTFEHLNYRKYFYYMTSDNSGNWSAPAYGGNYLKTKTKRNDWLLLLAQSGSTISILRYLEKLWNIMFTSRDLCYIIYKYMINHDNALYISNYYINKWKVSPVLHVYNIEDLWTSKLQKIILLYDFR